jgi:tol-pal system protein YbgF
MARDPPGVVINIPGNSITNYAITAKALEPGVYHVHTQTQSFVFETGTVDVSASKINNDDYKRSYIDALSAYNDGNYESAIQGFGRLVTGDPSHKLADNSQYWLGESYYALKNYKRAILEFEKVFQFKEQDKWDDTQLKLGICYQKIGNFDKARAEFQKLVDHYPGSEYYQRAQQYLRQL